MTIGQAIEAAARLRPDGYDDADKIRWLSELDGRIMTELLSGRIEFAGEGFDGYDENTDLGTELLVSHPAHEGIYVKWLMCMADFHNNETARYNSSAAIFNSAWQELAGYVSRELAPVQGSSVTRIV